MNGTALRTWSRIAGIAATLFWLVGCGEQKPAPKAEAPPAEIQTDAKKADLPPNVVEYDLPGDAAYQAKLYPPPSVIVPELGLTTPELVIAHFTKSSLDTDGIRIVADSLKVTNIDGSGRYRVRFETLPGSAEIGRRYATAHPLLLDQNHAGQAINGVDACKETPGCWNPMSGFQVNGSDGIVQWHLYLALGMPMVNHKSVTLLHYPPYVAMQKADYLNNMTLQRWQRLLTAVGLPESTKSLYDAILDVNPIAAPGSGQSEYENDYFPIMLSSVYFDNEKQNRNYIRSMLEAMLNPAHNAASTYTLPLLVGGSPLYDPQAPGWFRVRYRDQLPKVTELKGEKLEPGIPQMDVLQAGKVTINPDSRKATPYMGANHMIAAGVTGTCTSDPGNIPDIRRYEAEDLVAACFISQYAANPSTEPDAAKSTCCLKYFGNQACAGAPSPPTTDAKKAICTLAQIDLYFDGKKIAPVCSQGEAEKWCEQRTNGTFDPCTGFVNKRTPLCAVPPGGGPR
jgi:hypothetical protein